MPLPTPAEPKKYTTVYNDFRGVDFTNDPSTVWKKRSPYALNMIPNAGGIPYKRTGWMTEYASNEEAEIRNMWSFDYAEESHLIYVKGDKVLRLGDDETPIMTLSSADAEVTGVYFNAMSGGKFYFLADSRLMEFYQDGSTFKAKEIDAYVPTTLIGRSPSEGGTLLEDVNLLTRRRKEEFIGDSDSKTYYVSNTINTNEPVEVSVLNSDGDYTVLTQGTDYIVSANSIVFTVTHPTPKEGEDNVIIEYTATGNTEASEALKRCTVATVYNNKVFLGGTDGTMKSRVWYSAHSNPAYFPDLSYFVVGDDFGGVMGLIDLGEYLGAVKESNPESSTIFLAYPITFDEDTAYAIKQSITGVGALSKRTFNSLNGEQLFLSDDGIYGIMADMQSNEVASSFVKNRSYYVNGRLLEEPDLEKALSVVWNGFYVLCVNGNCYLLDSSQKTSWATERTNMQYEAYYWENVPATSMCTHNDRLYFGTNDGRICFFKDSKEYGNDAYNDNGAPIKCEWRTVLDSDGAVNYYKNMQKKGCVVVLQPKAEGTVSTSAEVYVKADDNDEEYVGAVATEQAEVPCEFYLNKKVKKYKRLQIIVRNDIVNESFGVQEIIKVYTIGNYSKNKTKGEETYSLFLEDGVDLYINGYGIGEMKRTETETIITVEGQNISLEYNKQSGNLYYK